MKAVLLLLLFLLSCPALAQEAPALSALRLVVTQALKKDDDNSVLLGLTKPMWDDYESTVPCPGVVETRLQKAPTRWKDGRGLVAYTWTCRIAEAPATTPNAFAAREAELAEAITRQYPKAELSRPTPTSHRWAVAPGVFVNLSASTIEVNHKDNLELWVRVEKTVRGSQADNVRKILAEFTAPLDKVGGDKDKLAGFCRTAYQRLVGEGVSPREASQKIVLLVQKAGEINPDAAFEAYMTLPMNADLTSILAALPANQQAHIRQRARTVVAEFKAKYEPPPPPPPTPRRVSRLPFLREGEVVTHSTSGKKVRLLGWNEQTGQYTIEELPGERRVVDDSYWDWPSFRWTVHRIVTCGMCGGTGKYVTRTPYSYERTEYGIYNKYTYSGSGYNTTVSPCSACNSRGKYDYKYEFK